jgi:beta-galactosidase
MNRRRFNQLAGLTGLAALAGPAFGSPDEAPRKPWDHYMVGAAYYPEWWTPDEWEEDFRQMHDLGINTVRMGEFAWVLFEPAAGKFDFAWMDRAIAIARRYKIDVILCTPTAAVPPWLYAISPDVLGASASGPFTYGGRKGYCTNSPHYLAASARITTALAEHYGARPEVIGWQLDNEPGIPFECLDDNCLHAFRAWLQARYKTLDELNRVWNGAFFSNKYSAWDQIHFPFNSPEGGWQPANTLNYREFFSDSYSNHLRRQSEILKKTMKVDQFIFTNFPSNTWSVDVFRAGAEFLTASAWDNYVSAPGLSSFEHQYTASFHDDFSRCAGHDQHFLCGEQIAYLPPNALHQGLRLQAYINLAHGAHGHLYFEWRRPVRGGEQYRPSFIKGFDGKINPAKDALAQTCQDLARLGPKLAAAKTVSDIALLYDFTNEFAQGFWNIGTPGDHYDSEAGRFYNGFKILQRNIDVVPLSRDFAAYRVIIAQNLRLIEDDTVARLQSFVKGGGVLVLNFRAATQHTDASMRRTLSPGPFREMVGAATTEKLDLLEYSPAKGQLSEELASRLKISFSGSDKQFAPRSIIEALTLEGAEPIASFHGDHVEGLPAVVRHKYGAGTVFYVGTDSNDRGFYEAIAHQVAASASLRPLIAAPYSVEVTSRQDADHTYYFLLNLTETPHADIGLPSAMDELVTGKKGVTAVSLGALEVAVLVAPRAK